MAGKMHKKTVIGLTGSFGTGKTTVAGIFRSLGATIIDADILAKQAIKPGSRAYRSVIQEFGKGVLRKDGIVNRKKLAGIVFSSRNKLTKLTSFIHPVVIQQIKKRVKRAQKGIIVIDVPLLIESGLEKIVDKIVVVKTSRATQIKRCVKKGFSESDVKMRIRHQLALAKKIQRADFVIDNNGSKTDTGKKVKKLWRVIKNGN